MAELNFGLLTPPGSQSIGNAFTQGMDQAAAAQARDLQMQHSMRQNEVSQMQMAKMRRDEQGLAEFSRKVSAMGGPSDPIEIAKAYLLHPEVEMQKFGAGLMQKAQTLAAYKLQFPDTAAAPSAPGVAPGAQTNALPPPVIGTAPVGQTNALLATPGAAPVGQTNALLATPGAAPAASTATVESRLAEIRAKLARLEPFTGTNGAPAAIREADMLKKEAEELLKSHTLAPSNTLVRAGLPNLTAPAAKSEFETLLGSSGLSETEMTAARRARVGKESTISYEFLTTLAQLGKTTDPYERGQLKNRLTRLSTHAPRAEAPAVKPLTALQAQKAKETQVAQRSVVKSADTAANELETLADALLGNPSKKIPPDPGLGGITGFMGVLPSMPESKARSAQQKLDTFKGKVMAFGRLLAVQQGKLGNMAVSEWKFISDAIEKIDPAANNFNDQLRDVVRQAKDFAAAKREAFDELYDSTTPTGGANAPQAPMDMQSAAQAEIARRAKVKR